jgi:D-alanyl-D-alanine carboxypeptidase/D-alanyl-D-alanine-endopeptidase (penicillin-binding protein 4)
MTERDAARVLRRTHEKVPSFVGKVLAISQRFLGAPYAFDPLGEGPAGAHDTDPTFSLKRVDCLTLIEQVLAMAHTPDLGRAKRLLQHLRYDGGIIDFVRRHHFAMSQWIPANQRLGVLRDVTRELGGERVVEARKRIDESTWRGRWRRWRRLLGARAPQGEFRLPVLPIDAAIPLAEKLPAGALLSIIRVDRPHAPDPVSHQGIVVLKNRRRFLRHASSGPNFRRVIDYPLGGYLRFSRRYFQTRWPVLGVNVQMPVESPALLAHP